MSQPLPKRAQAPRPRKPWGPILTAIILLLSAAAGNSEEPRYPPPGELELDDLEGIADLPAKRKEIVQTALDIRQDYSLDAYVYGSEDPQNGGFDCSGAVYYILNSLGFEPARSSDHQFEWLENAGKIRLVPDHATGLDHPAFGELQPGDLLFWSGTYETDSARRNPVTHVQIYLGKDKGSADHVMIGASDGRTYRKTKRTGYGVYDFRLPREGSRARFVGYGPPPGVE